MLGGNIVVIDEGRILQTGPTPEVYHNPKTTKVAEVFSDPPINYITCTVQEGTAYMAQDVKIPLEGHLSGLSDGNYTFGIRSNHFFLSRNGKEDVEIRTKVELAEINGSETFIHVTYDSSSLVVQEDGVHPHRMGTEVFIYVNPSNFFVFDEAGVLVASPARKPFEKRL